MAMTIQLANRSVHHHKGIVEDVLGRIENFLSVDIAVIETAPVANTSSQIPVILERPFSQLLTP